LESEYSYRNLLSDLHAERKRREDATTMLLKALAGFTVGDHTLIACIKYHSMLILGTRAVDCVAGCGLGSGGYIFRFALIVFVPSIPHQAPGECGDERFYAPHDGRLLCGCSTLDCRGTRCVLRIFSVLQRIYQLRWRSVRCRAPLDSETRRGWTIVPWSITDWQSLWHAVFFQNSFAATNTVSRPTTMFGQRCFVTLSTLAALVECVATTAAPMITPGPIIVKRGLEENYNFIGYYSSPGASTCKFDHLRCLKPLTHANPSQILTLPAPAHNLT
jgi:hypothetical protein